MNAVLLQGPILDYTSTYTEYKLQYIYIYIYICVCVCVCVGERVCVNFVFTLVNTTFCCILTFGPSKHAITK